MVVAIGSVIVGFALMYAALLWHLFGTMEGKMTTDSVWTSVARLWNPLRWRDVFGREGALAPVLLNLLGFLFIAFGAMVGWQVTTAALR